MASPFGAGLASYLGDQCTHDAGKAFVTKDAQNANSAIAAEILDYFLRNPEAADSMTEIARWRLVQGNIQRNVEATFAAVDFLLAEGYLRREARLGTDQTFQLNEDRLKDAERFVSGDGPTEP